MILQKKLKAKVLEYYEFQTIKTITMRHTAPKPTDKVEQQKPKAIIVDLGGTLAHRGERAKEDYITRFIEDTIDTTVRDLVNLEGNSGTKIIILTGQREKSRKVVNQWLDLHGVVCDYLVMKADIDKDDTIQFKHKLYSQLAAEFDIKYVLEDREEIVEMWRNMNVRCFQVASGQDREYYKQKAIAEQHAVKN